MAGPRAGLYGGEEFGAFRALLEPYEPDRPERLAQAYFAAPEPQESACWKTAPMERSSDGTRLPVN